MRGKIYGIGVGPGDPELMTLKAVRLIREADVIAIPGKDRESCTAYQIASGAVPEIKDKEIIPVVFPMTKNETVLRESHEAAVQSLTALMDQGKTIAFLTLGDVTIYSTYGYVHQKLLSLGYESILVNGVPSFCAAAAKLPRGKGGGDPHSAGILSGRRRTGAPGNKDLNEVRKKDRGREAGTHGKRASGLDGGKLRNGRRTAF